MWEFARICSLDPPTAVAESAGVPFFFCDDPDVGTVDDAPAVCCFLVVVPPTVQAPEEAAGGAVASFFATPDASDDDDDPDIPLLAF